MSLKTDELEKNLALVIVTSKNNVTLFQFVCNNLCPEEINWNYFAAKGWHTYAVTVGIPPIGTVGVICTESVKHLCVSPVELTTKYEIIGD